MIAKQETLFPKDDPIRYGDRRHRNLFIPRLLERESLRESLKDEKWKKAYEIICRWAALDISGKLENKNESNLEGEFFTEIFGDALGYIQFSEHKKEWNLQAKYSINGGIADGAIGVFSDTANTNPISVLELKGPKVNLDRDRFAGRTAVQQCWDYLYAIPECQWAIVSNYVSVRLYHRNHTQRVYQLFVLQDLRDKNIFSQFYYLLEKGGLLPGVTRDSRASILLDDSYKQQQQVGDDLYNKYNQYRQRLIQYLTQNPYNKPLDRAIRITQKLLDRIIFVAFCEDRELLPKNSLTDAFNQLPPFTRVVNPRWQNFLDLFHSIDKGNKFKRIPPFNGGLFKEDKEVDELDLSEDWTNFFSNIGQYDFRDTINVDVLGHIFEKSINEIEKIRLTGVFDLGAADEERPKMEKSAERKRSGVYYTPPQFTDFITHNVVAKYIDEKFDAIAAEMGINRQEAEKSEKPQKLTAYWQKCLEAIKQTKVVDPACGSGAFLISAYEVLEEKYNYIIDNIIHSNGNDSESLLEKIPDFILQDNLFGVDLSPEAVEITQLALWLKSAREHKTLADLSKNIVCGNSLIDDLEVDPRALNWKTAFPEIFSRDNPGFDCVIGNPPWERMKLQEREFFDSVSPEIAAAVNAANRRKLIGELEQSNPDLNNRYLKAQENAGKNLEYIRKSGRYPLNGKGDINTYAVFAELAYNIVSPYGRVGILVPSGIATDNTTKDFFGELIESQRLSGLYDFENKAAIFPDVHRSFKFSILLFSGKGRINEKADFVFFAHKIEELKNKKKHISLSRSDFILLNPNTRTCPIFRTPKDAELTREIYKKVPVLIDENRKDGGNPWGINFLRMFDQTNDAELFHTTEQLKKLKYKFTGNHWVKGKKIFLPLYEAKMIQMYDHRAASVVVDETNWMRQGQTSETSQVQHQNPEYSVEPRWWAIEDEINKSIKNRTRRYLIGLKDITSPTNQRTIIAAAIPKVAVTNHFPLIISSQGERLEMCLLGNLNSIILDFVTRQKIGGITLNFFIIEQLPIISPDYYSSRCPWNQRMSLEKWISDRVLKLTCTSNDMIPLAKAAGFDPPVHKWRVEERAELMAELDAAYFIMYGIERTDVEYILSTFSGIDKGDEDIFGGLSAFDRILKHYDNLIEKCSK